MPYVWDPEHDQAFNEFKQEVSTLGEIIYFDAKTETVIQTDAPLKGLGALILQIGQPVRYEYGAMKKTEQDYNNIERETLGVVWGLDRFYHYI